MTPSIFARPFITILFISGLFAASISAQDFDYGKSDLSPAELYEESLKHLYGVDGYKKSRGAAISQLKKAAALDHAPAHNMLGLLYLEGNGFFASPRKALRSFEEAARLGDILGKYNAGYSYLAGRGTTISIAQAEKFFTAVTDESATRNLSPEDFGTIRNARASAYFFLGLIYGDEDDPDFYDAEKATELYQKADELNEPNAAMLLAIRYAKGEGAAQDQAKSAAYLQRYKLSAVNKLHNSFNQVFFQGMDRETIKQTVDDIVASYEDAMTQRIQSLQTSFGISLLDDEELFDPAQAFVWLQPVADKDNPLACSRIATLYYKGEGTDQDFEKAREYLELSYKQNAMAKYNLAVMLAKGQGGPADPERAATLMQRAANDSWYPAIYYTLENAPVISEREALALVEDQANANDPAALYCYGRRLLFGLGVDNEFEGAKNLILQAAEAGNVQARYFYGVYIASDFSWLGATEEDKAIQEAADANYPPAIHFQGQKAENANRYKVALERYQKSASLGHAPSLYKLGKFYREGLAVDQDYSKAIDYFRQAADLDDSIGILNLGLAYEYGLGVETDFKEAQRLYREAIDRGAPYADLCMGNLLASGKLGQEAWEEAVPHWEKAAESRVIDAMLQLGDCYREGKGTSQNLTMAANYYYSAQRLLYGGDPDITYRIAQLKLIEKSDAYAPKQALNDLRMLELQGYPLAGYQLAMMNLEGIALKENPKKAFSKFLKTARSLGTDLAKELGDDYSRYYSKDSDLDRSTDPIDFETETIEKTAADACFQIARLLDDGKLKKADPSDAVVWYRIAANRGHPQAQLELGKLYLTGKYVQSDTALAWGWILKSATRLDEAKYFAASQFFEGKTESIAREEATQLLRSAAASGHQPSISLLEAKGLPLDPEDGESTPLNKERKGEDDGFDGPIDIDLALLDNASSVSPLS